MQIFDTATYYSKSASETKAIARSLLQSIYHRSTIICLFGDIGVGKTTFMQGLLSTHAENTIVQSPTFTLENTYELSPLFLHAPRQCKHIDLYRLNTKAADEFWQQVETDNTLVCIEWSEKLSVLPKERIEIHIEEIGTNDRKITIQYLDALLPSFEQIQQWQTDVLLPTNVIAHCTLVSKIAHFLAMNAVYAKHCVRPVALERAGLLHDLLRFIDFSGHQTGIPVPSKNQIETWQNIKHTYSNQTHEQAVCTWLHERDMSILGTIIASHGDYNPPYDTIERQLLFYADKRAKFDQIVSLQERHRDALVRYHDGIETDEKKMYLQSLLALEATLESLGISTDLSQMPQS